MTKLSEVPQIDSMYSSNSFIVEAGGSERRIPLANLKEELASSITTPPAVYTLEQNSNVAFNVSNYWAAYMYASYMKGYLFKVVAGKVYAALLNESWDAFADGTAIGNIAKYETMMRVPPCHFKGEGTKMTFGGLNPVAGGLTFDSPQWVGAYKMYVDASGVGHSRPNVAPSHSKTMSAFWSCAQKLHSNMGLANYPFQCLINAVYQAYYGNLDVQTTIGSGFKHSNWEACRDVPMGKCISLGNGSGKVLYNDATLGNQYPVKLFGFEDLYNKLWEFRPNIRFYMDGETRKAVIYSGNQVSNTANGREVVCLADTDGAFITKMSLGTHWDMIPTAVGGSDNTYYTDACFSNKNGELLMVGGIANIGSRCGIVCSRLNLEFGSTYTDRGARLAFFGTPTIVSGSQLVVM
nr:MAG TPA: hypothetical protein [Caudoviricetes sp.]